MPYHFYGDGQTIEDFDIDYAVAPLRTLISNPNIASLYLTAFIVECVMSGDKNVHSMKPLPSTNNLCQSAKVRRAVILLGSCALPLI